MITLSKSDKIANVKELLTCKRRKIENLEKEITNLENKLNKLQTKTEKSVSNFTKMSNF